MPAPAQKPKAQNTKQHAQAVARQILSEPFEILKSAGRQVGGESQTGVSTQQQQEQAQPPQQSQEAALAKRKKEASHIQAFQTELQEIKQLQEIRDRERQQLRLQEEQKKKQLEAQKANSNPLLEPVAKMKRGLLGGMGKMLGVKRKQRSAELTKTPSN